MTVLDALQWANEELKKNQTLESPMLDAEYLLAALLKQTKAWLFGHFNDTVPHAKLEVFRQAILRRAQNEPIAHILETAPFYGKDFWVNKFVLIPRIETEQLIDLAKTYAAQSPKDSTLVVDIGTGSGCIGITLGRETHLPVIASDISTAALTVAKKNAQDQALEQIDFRHGAGLGPITRLFEELDATDTHPFTHMILCANLPYLTPKQVTEADSDVRDHEPHLALTSGPDGLNDYWQLFTDLRAHRSIFPKQILTLIEIDPSQEETAPALISHMFPTSFPTVIKDQFERSRFVQTEI